MNFQIYYYNELKGHSSNAFYTYIIEMLSNTILVLVSSGVIISFNCDFFRNQPRNRGCLIPAVAAQAEQDCAIRQASRTVLSLCLYSHLYNF